MDNRDDLAPPPRAQGWASIDRYLWGARRRGSAARRHHRSAKPAHEREPERAWLATLPFLVLIAALAIITIAIVSLARPGALRSQAAEPPPQQQAEQGRAAPGWLDEG
jgi:hypothetical protein